MSYAYDPTPSWVVARAQPSERAQFIQRTYLHLAGAILAFVAIEAAIFATFGVQNIINAVGRYMQSPAMTLLVFGLFIGAGFLAQYWAQSRTSRALQYAGLSLYVVAEAVIFIPILAICQMYAPDVIPMAGILTLSLFAGLSAAAILTKKDFSFLAPILSISFFAVLGIIVISMLFGFQLGMWFSILMVGLASASILYQTSNIMMHYSTDMYVAASLALFAAIATLFYYILRILLQMRDR